MSLLHQSIAGGVLIAVILVIRSFTIYRLPKAVFKVLWIVAAARLLLPFSIPSRFSLYSFIRKLADSDTEKLVSSVSQNNTGIKPQYAPLLQGIFPAVSGSAAKEESFLSLPQICYLAGLCLLAACFLVSYIRCQQKFREAIPTKHSAVQEWLKEIAAGLQKVPVSRRRIIDRCLKKRASKISVRVSDQICAPLTYGTIFPVILLPKRMDWNDGRTIQYILDHEYNHILHFDALNKIILAVILCIHWFNPIVWVMYFLANRDMELYCDEAVVRKGKKEARESYALALLHMEEVRKLSFSLYSYFSKNKMEERIVAIMKIKKNSILSLTFAAALVAGTTTLFATSALAEDSTEKKLSKQESNQNEITVSPTPAPTEKDNEKYKFENDTESYMLSNNQIYTAPRYVMGEDGLKRDSEGNPADQIFASPPEKDRTYDFEPGEEEELRFPTHSEIEDLDVTAHSHWTEEKLKQVIEDIESGKIKGSLVKVINTDDGEYLELTDQNGNKMYGTFIACPEEESDYYLKEQEN